MVKLKQFFGFLMMATVIWILWVFGHQVARQSLQWLLMGLLLTAVSVWIWGKWDVVEKTKTQKTIGKTMAAIFLLLGLGIPLIGIRLPQTVAGSYEMLSQEGISWEPFSKEKLFELRNAGEPVFVDFTAAWCLTCQVNERIALNRKAVIERFEQYGIHALKADWTSRDDRITEALAEYGRNSIPLYVYYARGVNQDPVLLPEIITQDMVLQTITEPEDQGS